MENSNALQRRDPDYKQYYHSSILGCFLSSLGACLAFLPNLPSDFGQKSDIKEITYSVVTAVYCVAALCVQLLLVYFVRNRENFHKSQLVLWPKRCQECARVLGMLSPNAISSEDLDMHYQPPTPTSPSSSQTVCSSINVDSDVDTDTDTSWSQSQTTSPSPVENTASPSINHNFSSSTSNKADDTTSNITGLSLHSCLKNAFMLFCLLSLVGFQFLLLGQVVCLVNHRGNTISLSVKEVSDVSLLISIPLAMKLAASYYDAVFVSTRRNSASLALFLSVGIWLCVSQFKNPISQLMKSPHSKIGKPCDLNGTLGKIIDKSQALMTPIYTQSLIIAVAILWQMCTSLTPKATLPPSLRQHHFEACQPQSVRSLLQSIAHHSNMYIRYVFMQRRMNKGDRRLVERMGGSSGLQEYVYKTWTLSVVMSGCNLILTFIVSSQYTKENYVMQSLDMALFFPLVLRLVHERYMARTQQNREIHMTPISTVYLEGHDVLLLLCSCGLFCMCIFRVSAAVGLLFSDAYVEEHGIVRPTYSIIYSLYSSVWIWLTTSFFLRVQRQVTKSIREVKLVLACLIYIITINVSEWIRLNFIFVERDVETHFFCKKTEEIMRVLLNPFLILFFSFGAIIAYESYKVIFKEALMAKEITLSIQVLHD